MNVAMLFGTVVFSLVFGYFMLTDAALVFLAMVRKTKGN